METVLDSTIPRPSGKAKVHRISMSDLLEYIRAGGSVSASGESGLIYTFTRAMLVDDEDDDEEYKQLLEKRFEDMLTNDVNSDVANWEDNKLFLASMTPLVQKKVASTDIRRGDIVEFTFLPEYGYRNVGKAIWDGAALERLDSSIDEYGSVPTSYVTLHPYPIGYFSDAIAHNFLHTFRRSDIGDEMEKNTPETPNSFERITFFTVGGRRYYVHLSNPLGKEHIVVDIDPQMNSEDNPGLVYRL